ncbi:MULTISPECIES: MarR family winged helix-turn-helix transcriptional regulator [Streptomyces]|uniref:MarR family winged helix-turn-helix transcriptional regulator n=1 Tax=Streptomyces sudanensis TaxID=436397 RepID=A0ABY4TEN7_9ACTN|nr:MULTISPECIES: MarR family winged helix-turn-helix transcriptional regulator [Streptomyces]MCP9958501.1 MarR family winged helix-turn-helix transcriptional regulator [Streptomyces sudanensis]MCP9987619.1 MarR family winged helix-turn-helix transcriptional regulator [Streptomyces sudanensis]MCQ0000989.1 MarR family winged helix-turn-helix transcriptional regulator [Streptomyces sudanensis]URN16574.1 MarR family winged helix-turn-helix transcriptional regulator [Streptomyces sudanensis]
MEYSHDDAELVNQPIGYWMWAANKTVMAYVRGRLAAIGVTQPQWWVLHQARHSEDGVTREEVMDAHRAHHDVGAGLAPDIDLLVERNLLVQGGDGRLRITDEGRELHRRAAETQRASRARVHEGIGDEEYLTALKVLQRMIVNAGGDLPQGV